MNSPDQPLWSHLTEAVATNPDNLGVPDLDQSDWAIIFEYIADVIEQRGTKQLDLDPGETSEWLYYEAAICRDCIQPRLPRVTVGEILKEEFMDPLGLSPADLAIRINVPEDDINQIISCKLQVTEELDYLLCNYFGLSQGYFLRISKRQQVTS